MRVFVSISSSLRHGLSPGRAPLRQRLITGISQDRQFPQVGASCRQDELAGGGQVMGATRQHVADPQRDAARGGQGLHVPGGLMGLAGVPLIDFPALPAGLLLRAPVRGDQSAIQDQVGKPLLNSPFQSLPQAGCPGGEDFDGLVLSAVGRSLRDPGALAQPTAIQGERITENHPGGLHGRRPHLVPIPAAFTTSHRAREQPDQSLAVVPE